MSGIALFVVMIIVRITTPLVMTLAVFNVELNFRVKEHDEARA